MLEPFYNLLTVLFAPVLAMPKPIGEMIVATLMIFIITLFYKYFANQKQIKELRERMNEIQKKTKELQKTEPEKANEMTKEMFEISNKMMKSNFKPMIPTLIFVILIFPWVAKAFPTHFINLPFEILGRTSFGWFLWYVIISVPMSIIFRKLLSVSV